jgi:hypothetical protein
MPEARISGVGMRVPLLRFRDKNEVIPTFEEDPQRIGFSSESVPFPKVAGRSERRVASG